MLYFTSCIMYCNYTEQATYFSLTITYFLNNYVTHFCTDLLNIDQNQMTFNSHWKWEFYVVCFKSVQNTESNHKVTNKARWTKWFQLNRWVYKTKQQCNSMRFLYMQPRLYSFCQTTNFLSKEMSTHNVTYSLWWSEYFPW